jgi:hypothetical protein
MLLLSLLSLDERSFVEARQKEFAPVSTIVKKALHKYLSDQGIEWRETGEEEKGPINVIEREASNEGTNDGDIEEVERSGEAEGIQ